MCGRTVRRAAVVAVAVLALTGCRGEEADEGNPAASPAASSTTAPPLAELPVPRTEVAGATWEGRLTVAGGLTADGGASALVHTYDAATGRWDVAPPLPLALHHAGTAVVAGRLYVVGGYTNGPGQPWRPQAGLWSLGPGEGSWRPEPPMPGGARGALGAAVAGGLLVAVGGESRGTVLARTEVFDPRAAAWRAGPDLSRPREHLAVAAAGDRVYAVAGRAGSLDNFRTVQSLDPVRDRAWRDEPEVGDARGGTAAAAVDGRICVAGGEEAAGTIASVECLDGRLHAVAGGERPGLFVSGAHEALDV